ncbi:MAG: mucoidy inhibitor MuiA family protein [Rhodospirillales bacterium]|nr:mucoidy inhibitor MuiA family protein [Alphaproteobacteria bacterium]MCB9981962.1 mucoidy inhibitor MuiA family protein [Rhodospirillales bacterium]
MHKILIFTALFFIPFTNVARADEIPASSTLKAATVFVDRATLTRSVKINISAGKHVVVFEGLPANLFPDSLRVQGQGTAKATLGALSNKIVNSVELTSEREQELTASLETLENQKKIIAAEKQALSQKRRFLESLAARAGEKESEDIAEFNLNTEGWLASAETIYTGISETLKSELEKDQQSLDLQKQINKITQDLNQRRTGQKRTYEVRLPVEVASAGTLTLALDYQIGGISWHPVYDARLDTKTAGLEIVQYGSVSQRTGEDWSNIELTLSTAQPHRGATTPNLPPMWVGLYDPTIASRQSVNTFSDAASTPIMAVDEGRTKMEGLADDKAPLEKWRRLEEEREATPVAATINTGGFTAEYKIPGLSSIPADGTQTKVLIAPFDTETKLEVHIKPQINTNAYLIAKTTLKGESPILPGPVSLFLDGAFVGQTGLPLLRPGGEHDLSFGIDDQIEVTYKTLKDESDEEGIIMNKTKSVERHTVTEIHNLRTKPVNIVTLQVLPASKNKDIKLEILAEHTTKDYERDHDKIKGLSVWDFALDPGAKKDVKLGWKLSWPQDKTLTGLR